MINFDKKINLLWLSEDKQPPDWGLGDVLTCLPTPVALHNCLKMHMPDLPADAWLFWDSGLDFPAIDPLLSCLEGPANVWHAGLLLGLSGQPKLIDFVQPTWMLNRDPDPGITASSWRLSLRACLIRNDVLRQLGGPDPRFETLAGAGLELGYRYIRNGAFVRHVPGMLPNPEPQPPVVLPLLDQMRFIRAGFTRLWQTWAGFRSVMSMKISLFQLWRDWRAIREEEHLPDPGPFQRSLRPAEGGDLRGRVSVLIPTLRRYPYLRRLLDQLRAQTVPPLEILVIDQTPEDERDYTLVEDFHDLPIRYFTLDRAGQCISRNLGLQESKGDFILFIDDDDEIPADLVEKHLVNLGQLGVDISNGVAHEVGAGELPKDFRLMRVSSVFPTNNTMIRKSVLEKSGLFDLAYDHGQRADHDLGMRLYLSGELMVLNPDIAVLHHHAPSGGLREHKARVDTYAASRKHLFKHNLPTVSDIYLAKRYFSRQQIKEMLWISLLGTFSFKGSFWKHLSKVIISTCYLPQSLWTLNQRSQAAEALLLDYPQIPELSEENTP